MGEPIIKLENVSKTFSSGHGDVEAVRNIDLSIEKGDIFGIIGLSGAGKSTLVRCLNLLERPTEGRVYIDGKDMMSLSNRELAIKRRDIGMIFQHFNLLMQRNVLDNVAFPLEIAGHKRSEARKMAEKYLHTVGLSEKADAYPAQLSGGQKQRVAIARVLASDPKILLCDEATSALDPQTTKSILELIKNINHDLDITVVIITHEMSVVQEICNKVAVLDHGSKVEEGTVEELFRSPKTEEAKKLVFSETAHIRRMHSDRQIRVIFDGKSAFEPILGNITLELKTPLNILYANTQTINGNAQGEMILQLPPNKEVADKMVEYFKEKNLGAEEVNYVD